MITIIQHGEIPYKYKKFCPRCHCLFGFNDNDIDITGPFYDPIYEIICPECNYKITSYSKDLS